MTGEELKALPGRAGLDAAEHWRNEEVLPARAAWRRITAAADTPAPTVRGGRAAEVNEGWHRLAVAHGLFDDDGAFLIRLAPDDPDSTAEPAERFGRDPSDEVRRRAAADPRLSAASAVRLLSDPHEGVRYEAARHPRLPARTLVGLLRSTETAQNAARHPGLPVAVMRRMADVADAGGAG